MNSKEKTWISFLFSIVLLVCFASIHPVLAADDIIVTFTAQNSWQNENGTGYQYEVTLKNESSSPVSGWNFVLDMGAAGSYDQSWCCNAEAAGQLLSITPLDWNSTIGAGGEISGIGIVLISKNGDIFSGSYRRSDSDGTLTKIQGSEPTPTPGTGPTPTPGADPTPAPGTGHDDPGTHSYPSGTGMYGPLTLNGVNLCNANGTPVQLRGVSTHGLAWYPQFVNSETFRYLRDDWGVNLIRLAMYTAEYGGYCSGGDRAYLEDLIDKGVQACSALGMYCIIDWHILADNDPNINKESALDFFSRMSAKYSGYNNVIYEICNEPHGVTWSDIKSYADEVIPVIRANAPDAIIIVGTNTWSQDVMDPASNPVADPYNVMYAVHFYAATHGGWLRDRVVNARNSGVPIFVSEFSTCDASGNGAIDYNEAAGWRDLIMNSNLSYAGWNLANKDESSSIVKGSCSKLLDWSEDEISDTGKWLRALIRDGKASEPDIIILPDDEVDTLILPEMLSDIGEEAFMGIKAEKVILPENIRTVGSRAFADSENLKTVVLGNPDVVIADDAFEGCGEIEKAVGFSDQ